MVVQGVSLLTVDRMLPVDVNADALENFCTVTFDSFERFVILFEKAATSRNTLKIHPQSSHFIAFLVA